MIKRPRNIPVPFEVNTYPCSPEELIDLTQHPAIADTIADLVAAFNDSNLKNFGSIDVYTDDENKLHIEFVTDFEIEIKPRIVEFDTNKEV